MTTSNKLFSTFSGEILGRVRLSVSANSTAWVISGTFFDNAECDMVLQWCRANLDEKNMIIHHCASTPHADLPGWNTRGGISITLACQSDVALLSLFFAEMFENNIQ